MAIRNADEMRRALAKLIEIPTQQALKDTTKDIQDKIEVSVYGAYTPIWYVRTGEIHKAYELRDVWSNGSSVGGTTDFFGSLSSSGKPMYQNWSVGTNSPYSINALTETLDKGSFGSAFPDTGFKKPRHIKKSIDEGAKMFPQYLANNIVVPSGATLIRK